LSYKFLVAELRRASRAARCPTRGFHDMNAEHIASQFSLTLEQAQMAKKREFDEPFVVLEEARREALIEELERAGLSCTSGGRLLHLSGQSDKGVAVRELIQRYESAWGPVRSFGLGDGMNDIPMLKNVSVPVILRSPSAPAMAWLLPGAIVTDLVGPLGWNQAVLELVTGEPVA